MTAWHMEQQYLLERSKISKGSGKIMSDLLSEVLSIDVLHHVGTTTISAVAPPSKTSKTFRAIG